MENQTPQTADTRPSTGTDAFGRPLVYEHPKAIGLLRRMAEQGVVLLGYVLWGYTCWLLYNQMVNRGGIKSPVFFGSGFGIVLLLFLLILAWNRYNIRRFRGHDRRKARGDTTAAEMARPFHLKEGDVNRLQAARSVRITFVGRTITLTPDGRTEIIEGRYDTHELAHPPQNHATHAPVPEGRPAEPPKR